MSVSHSVTMMSRRMLHTARTTTIDFHTMAARTGRAAPFRTSIGGTPATTSSSFKFPYRTIYGAQAEEGVGEETYDDENHDSVRPQQQQRRQKSKQDDDLQRRSRQQYFIDKAFSNDNNNSPHTPQPSTDILREPSDGPAAPSLSKNVETTAALNVASSTSTSPKPVRRKPTSLVTLRSMYRKNIPLAMVTAYDVAGAQAASRAGADLVLVGDSLGMVVHGHSTTVHVTMEDVIRHTQAVARGAEGPLVVGDLPFGSYITPYEAVSNAVRLIKEGSAQVVKMEGGKRVFEHAKAITDAGIAVMGHVGLTPQTSTQLGGFRSQGRTAKGAVALIEDALALQEAGCFAIVLECMPDEVSRVVTATLDIPTIGIGAGVSTSGQVLVYHDILGMYTGKPPRFAKIFAPAGNLAQQGISNYVSAVKTRSFPTPNHTVYMKEKDHIEFKQAMQEIGPQKLNDAAQYSPRPPLISVPPNINHVCILGGGAMGSLLAAKLSTLNDVQVTMVTNLSEHANAIENQDRSIKLRDTQGGVRYVRVNVVQSIDDLHDTVDLAIVATKSSGTTTAARNCKQIVKRGGCILSVQNGMASKTLADLLGRNEYVTLPCVTTHGATLVAPGQVHHAGFGDMQLALQDDVQNIMVVADVLNRAGLNCNVSEPMQQDSILWRKLLMNAVVNPLTALLDVPNGGLRDISSCTPLIESIVAEVTAIATAKGIVLSTDADPIQLVRDVIEKTANNTSSMRSDVRSGRETEVKDILGYLIEQGLQVAVPTPVLSTLESMICSVTEKVTSSYASMHDFTVVDTIDKMRSVRAECAKKGSVVGCVPTMGGLHDGHLSLVRQAKQASDIVVATVFINPKQFAAHEDLDKYPNSLARDIELLKEAGADIVFTPKADEMYPEDFCTEVGLAGIDSLSEGKARPGFFKGVATVVSKLFNIIQPDIAVFGQKDFLQTVVIKKLVNDLAIPVEIRVGDTARETDGVAMSTRNQRLTPAQRQAAPELFKALSSARSMALSGTKSVAALKKVIIDDLSTVPEFSPVDYVSIASRTTGVELDEQEFHIAAGETVISAGVQMRDDGCDGAPVRLIDNIVI